jgi:hypothetical protein
MRADRYTEIEKQWRDAVVAGFPSDIGFWPGVSGSPFRTRISRDINDQLIGRVEIGTLSQGVSWLACSG